MTNDGTSFKEITIDAVEIRGDASGAVRPYWHFRTMSSLG